MGRKSKKLDWKNVKYIIKKILNSYLVKLDTPKGINDVFYVNKLCAASINLFFNQLIDDTQPPLIQNNGEDEWIVEEIMAEIKKKKGREWEKKYEIK